MICLTPPSREDLRILWEQGHADPWWPKDKFDLVQFLNYSLAQEYAREAQTGDLLAIYTDGKLGGYIVYNKIPTHLLPDGTCAAECGTFLLETHRGTGLNAEVKKRLLALLFDKECYQFALFVVDKNNIRAQSAFRKLPWQTDVSYKEGNGVFMKYCKRRSWELNRETIVYSIARADFYKLSTLARV